MDLRHGFTMASGWQGVFPLPSKRDCVLITSKRDPFEKEDAKSSNHGGRWVMVASLGDKPDADVFLKSVVDWLCENHGLDQSALYGSHYEDYNITMIRFPKDSFPGVIGQFYLTDYLFSDRHLSDIQGPDDLMRMLDRDRLAKYMRAVLVEDLEFAEAKNPDLSWMDSFRACCHPDCVPWAGHVSKLQPVYA